MTHSPLPRMTPAFSTAPEARPLWLTTPETLDGILDALPQSAANWARAQNASGRAGEVIVLPDDHGNVLGALVGNGATTRQRFAASVAASRLPQGSYAIQNAGGDLNEFALGWLLESYRFDRYADQKAAGAKLTCPPGCDARALERIATSEFLARDLINTPAADMGPDGIEAAARDLAKAYGATLTVITGDDLLAEGFPLIHAVGRAGERAPRLIDMSWGTAGPRLTLVGKGVAFDTGGLNLKPGSSMALMKKDMGGSANVLALARAIMDANWDMQLRVLIPAVENNVAANAFRPGDILTGRNGLTIEVNNTDAEGRLVLADALALAAESTPDQIISMATLTGAARVAVGPDIAPFYTGSDRFAQRIAQCGEQVCDPVWRMPFHDPYESMLDPGIANLDNAPGGGMAGSITAALFLRRFVNDLPYAHFDIYGWTPTAAPARPKGGAGQGWRALFAALPQILT